MSKTRKHKPSSRKIRKHKPTRKQTGGVCCRYEKDTEGQGCDGTPYERGNNLPELPNHLQETLRNLRI